jgi:hypothetical protein
MIRLSPSYLECLRKIVHIFAKKLDIFLCALVAAVVFRQPFANRQPQGHQAGNIRRKAKRFRHNSYRLVKVAYGDEDSEIEVKIINDEA